MKVKVKEHMLMMNMESALSRGENPVTCTMNLIGMFMIEEQHCRL